MKSLCQMSTTSNTLVLTGGQQSILFVSIRRRHLTTEEKLNCVVLFLRKGASEVTVCCKYILSLPILLDSFLIQLRKSYRT